MWQIHGTQTFARVKLLFMFFFEITTKPKVQY